MCDFSGIDFYAEVPVDLWLFFTPLTTHVGPLNATFSVEADSFAYASFVPNVTVYGFLDPLRTPDALLPTAINQLYSLPRVFPAGACVLFRCSKWGAEG